MCKYFKFATYLRHLDRLLPRHAQRQFMQYLSENGIYELDEEKPIYQLAHEMAVSFALDEACLSQI